METTSVLNERGTVAEALDYYPYGSTRISQQTSGYNEAKQYVGQYEDPETSLSYLQARYYSNVNGQFLSEDPIFLGDPRQQTLTDPQSLNSYAYANDNPITKSDPTGKFAPAIGVLLGGGVGLSPETLGVSLLIAGGAVSAIYLATHGFPSFGDGAPGNFQASQEVSGNGASPDPQYPFGRPGGKWGPAAVGTGFSLLALKLIGDHGEDAMKQYVYGGELRMSKNYVNWQSQPGIKVNNMVYGQNVVESLKTGAPSYTAPSSNGTNVNYASQTYRTPSGAVIDWGGNIVVGASSGSQSQSASKSK